MYNSWRTSLSLIISFVIIGTCLGELNDVIDHPVVHTKLGSVRGNTHEVMGLMVHVFHGIPFARPPVGQLRFKRPVPADPWNGTLDGTRKHNACIQLGTEETWKLTVPESEDCLYLNVYVPERYAPLNSSRSNGTALPVMFFIYGGGFIRGTTSIDRYNGSMLAVINDVIVVTADYRLGAFGYLFSGTPEAPGNAGVLDNLMALQWVHDNIESFGGDPGSVTIFGGSAGAFSVGFLMLSPLSHNLFQRAILMSGAPLSIGALYTSIDKNLEIIEILGNFTSCNRNSNTTTVEIVACLKTVSAEILDVAQESFSAFYRPVIDGYFIPNHVASLYEEVVRKNISVVLGITQNEGSMFVASYLNYDFSKSENLSISHEVLHLMINKIMNRYHLNSMQKHAVNYLYSNWEDIYDNEANRQIASEFFGDFIFVCPTNEFGHQLSDRNLPVYYYKFDHRPSNTPFPAWAGAAHGDDIFFIFGHPMVSKNEYTDRESELSYYIVKSFGNFAKLGIPSVNGVSWPRYTRSNQQFLTFKLNSAGYRMTKGPRANECALWNNLLHKLIEKDECDKRETVAETMTNEKRMNAGNETLDDTEE